MGWRMGRGPEAGGALSGGRLSQHSTPQIESVMAHSDNLTWLAARQ